MLHKEWCDLISTLGDKDNRNVDAAQIKILATQKDVPDDSDRNTSPRVPHSKKNMIGVLSARKQEVKKTLNHKGSQIYFVMYMKDLIT